VWLLLRGSCWLQIWSFRSGRDGGVRKVGCANGGWCVNLPWLDV